jgi:DNA processing protein
MSYLHWLAFGSAPGIGGAAVRGLLARFGDLEAAYAASDAALLRVARLTTAQVAHLRGLDLARLQTAVDGWNVAGIRALTWEDAEFPAPLLALRSPPPVLFVRGALAVQDARAVAIVGTRTPSPAGARLATRLARGLAAQGVTIVSGLALGIDTCAHIGSLHEENGRSLAVLGAGLRHLHPRRNAPLAARIARRGALLSEQWPDAPLEKTTLVARNRIISGLSAAVIVVEAPLNSGSLHAARSARRQGRLLLAVPGSPGADALLAQGAEALAPDKIDLTQLAQRIADSSAPGGNDAVHTETGPDTRGRQLSLFD